jgi:hypothetical protein
LLSKNVNTETYRTIILPVVLPGSETRSLALSEVHRLEASENRMPRKVFGPRGDEVIEICIIRSFITCILRQIKL